MNTNINFVNAEGEYRENIIKKLSENLKVLRVATGMKQAEFAEIIGVTRASMSNWERGSKLSWTVALAILIILLQFERCIAVINAYGILEDEREGE